MNKTILVAAVGAAFALVVVGAFTGGYVVGRTGYAPAPPAAPVRVPLPLTRTFGAPVVISTSSPTCATTSTGRRSPSSATACPPTDRRT